MGNGKMRLLARSFSLPEQQALHGGIVADWREEREETDELRVPNPISLCQKGVQNSCYKIVRAEEIVWEKPHPAIRIDIDRVNGSKYVAGPGEQRILVEVQVMIRWGDVFEPHFSAGAVVVLQTIIEALNHQVVARGFKHARYLTKCIQLLRLLENINQAALREDDVE